MSGSLSEPVADHRWPLHPQPTEWESLETWVRRIAEAYGVSYDAFLLNALGHTGRGARDLDRAPICVLVRLSAGTGVPIERLLDMTVLRLMARTVGRTRVWQETAEGRAAYDSISGIASRRGRRMAAERGF